MENNHHHPHLPLLTATFSAVSFISNWVSGVDLSGIDATLLEPLAHIIAIVSGTVAITLGLWGGVEKYRNNGKRKP